MKSARYGVRTMPEFYDKNARELTCRHKLNSCGVRAVEAHREWVETREDGWRTLRDEARADGLYWLKELKRAQQ